MQVGDRITRAQNYGEDYIYTVTEVYEGFAKAKPNVVCDENHKATLSWLKYRSENHKTVKTIDYPSKRWFKVNSAQESRPIPIGAKVHTHLYGGNFGVVKGHYKVAIADGSSPPVHNIRYDYLVLLEDKYIYLLNGSKVRVVVSPGNIWKELNEN